MAEEPKGDAAVLDFDMLCAAVALQTQGGEERGIGGGKRGILEEAEFRDCGKGECLIVAMIGESQLNRCPCYRFGKNMRRANLGPCFLQGSMYFLLALAIISNFIAFGVTEQHCYLYMGIAFVLTFGLYLVTSGVGSESSLTSGAGTVCWMTVPTISSCRAARYARSDFMNEQESRTLEMNNVQDGIWRGRGDTILCVGTFGEGSKEFSALLKPSLLPNKSPEVIGMERTSNGSDHSWNVDACHSEPLVASAQSVQKS